MEREEVWALAKSFEEEATRLCEIVDEHNRVFSDRERYERLQRANEIFRAAKNLRNICQYIPEDD